MQILIPVEYANQRILTTEQIAEAYETDTKIISNNFNRNKDRYVEGKHFYCLKGNDLKNFLTNHQIDDYSPNTPQLYLWTEKGVLLHAKSLNTDKAWEVYENLVDHYFRTREPIPTTESLAKYAELLEQTHARITLLEQAIYDMAAMRDDEPLQLQAKNTVELFLKKCMYPCAGNIVSLHDIYALYVRWCNISENNFKPMFKISLESTLRNRYLLRNKKGLRNIVTDFEFRV